MRGLDLDLFILIKQGHNTTVALAEACNGSPRGVGSLLDVMSALGFLTKEGKTFTG